MAYLGHMCAHTFKAHRLTFPIATEPKLDGLRVTHTDGEGYTRRGNTYETYRPFSLLFHQVAGAIHVDTEMTARTWNEASKALKRKKNIDVALIKAEAVAWVFDAFSPANVGWETYLDRRKAVEWIVAQVNALGSGYTVKATPVTIVNDQDELDAAFVAARASGAEGLMIKTLAGVYLCGNHEHEVRSWDWMKWKPFRDISVTVIGYDHQRGNCPECMPIAVRRARAKALGVRLDKITKGIPECLVCRGDGEIERPDVLGALICKTDKGQELRVGGGFTMDQRIEFWAWRATLPGKRCDVKVQDDESNDIVARHPNFVRWREDR